MARSAVDHEERIFTGPDQKRPKNWLNAHRNSSFKTVLVASLIDCWGNNHLHSFISCMSLVTTLTICLQKMRMKFISPKLLNFINSTRSRLKEVVPCCTNSTKCKEVVPCCTNSTKCKHCHKKR